MAQGKIRWYVIHVYSGFEKKIVEAIEEQAKKKGIEDQFERFLVPSEEVVEVRRGRKVNSERKFFPGYIMAHMLLTDQSWSLVTTTPRVTGFLGGRRPTPMSDDEAERLVQQVQEGVGRPVHAVIYVAGEKVRVKDGPFNSFEGVVEEVDMDRERMKVSVSIFGRSTPVELDFGQVEKA